MAFYTSEHVPQAQADPAFAADVLRHSPAITYVYDLKARRSIYQNRSLESILGYPEPHSADSAWSHLMHEEDQARFPAYRARLELLRPGQESHWEYRLRAPDGSWRWFLSRDAVLALDADGRPHTVVGSAADITTMKEAQNHNDLLLEEARHRTKNFTAIMLSLAKQSAPRDGEDAKPAFDRFVGRMRAILEAGNLVMATEGRIAPLQALIETSLEALMPDFHARVFLNGPPVMLGEREAGGIMLVVHELTTNAIKHGALSTTAGTVHCNWDLVPPRRVRLRWREIGGPRVTPPAKTGFGTQLLKSTAASGTLTIDYADAGLGCSFELDALV